MSKEREFVITQYCVDHGFVMRTKNDLHICDNPKCNACTPFREGLEETMQEFVDAVTNHPEFDEIGNMYKRLNKPRKKKH